MKSKTTSIILVIILISQSLASSVLANEYQRQVQQATNNVQPYNNQAPPYAPATQKKEESHPIRNGLIGVAVAGLVTVGLVGLATISVLKEGGMLK